MFYYKIVSNSTNQGPLSIGADWNIAPPMICPVFFLKKFAKVRLMSVVKAMYPLHIKHMKNDLHIHNHLMKRSVTDDEFFMCQIYFNSGKSNFYMRSVMSESDGVICIKA